LDLALEQLSRMRNLNGKLPLRLLKEAGRILSPAAVQDYLNDDNPPVLIISPHRDLHRLPWAGLHINGDKYRPLVEAVTPVIIPSLQTLSLLWQRPYRTFTLSDGLLLAASSFQNQQHGDLPAVKDEVRRLKPFLGSSSRILTDQLATADAFITTVSAPDSPRDYWHIASHAFHDGQSGRLSGLALYDRDFLLDELWQLAPLPNLVTFSACGSGKSRLFEGDEHVGLTTTCLTAGANQVVGSIWEIEDVGMPGIMADFYAELQNPTKETAVPVSYALAQAQRQAWKQGENWPQWAGFRCTGRP
jgi:CHAT domain-containing protein